MKLSTIQALERAILMLQRIAAGQQYSRGDFYVELQRLERARDAHLAQEAADAAARAEIRIAAEKRRAVLVPVDASYGADLGAEAIVRPFGPGPEAA